MKITIKSPNKVSAMIELAYQTEKLKFNIERDGRNNIYYLLLLKPNCLKRYRYIHNLLLAQGKDRESYMTQCMDAHYMMFSIIMYRV